LLTKDRNILLDTLPGRPKKWHPFQVRQHNATSQTAKYLTFIPLEQFPHLLIYSRLKCAHSFEKTVPILSKPQCFSKHKLWIKTIETKLQLICVKKQN